MINRKQFFRGIFSNAVLLSSAPAAAFSPRLEPSVIDQSIIRHPTLASESNAPVGVQLILAMDTSHSMSNEEFSIELEATAQALNSELVRNGIKYKGGEKSVAVCVLDFDSKAYMRIPWVDLRGQNLNDKPYLPNRPGESSAAPDKLDMLAKEIVTLYRRGSGGTAIEKALNLSKEWLLKCPWNCVEKRVVDVFGDGTSGTIIVRNARDQLAAIGTTINGLAIVNEIPELEEYFRKQMITVKYTRSPEGILSEPGRVWAVARNMQEANNRNQDLTPFFDGVTQAMKQKISVEIADFEDYQRIAAKLNGKIGDLPSIPSPG
jgi:hypothetical protein